MEEGWLLNADYVTRNNRAIVRLWVVSGENRHVLLDKNFKPYFYVIPERDSAEMEVERFVEKVEWTRRRDHGREVEVLKVYARHPQEVPKIREEISKLPSVREVREADIPFAIRYLIDKGLIPCGVIEWSGEELPSGEIEVSEILPVEKGTSDPPFKVMAFDIEVYNPHLSTKPERDPIIVISCCTNTGESKLFLAERKGGNSDDRGAIKEFISFVKSFDPDVIIGYNSDNYDWPYLRSRCEILGIPLEIGRDGSPPKFRGGARRRIKIVGRANVDLYRVAERDLGEVKIKTLENIGAHLGIDFEKAEIPKDKIWEYWDSEREELLQYALGDSLLTMEIGLRLLPLQYEFSRMIRRPLDEVYSMGRGKQVESYLINEAYSRGELVPQKPRELERESYEGALVLKPKKGLHENVICLDFASMYPNIMIAYNISPDTLCKDCSEEEAYVAPYVNHKFRKEPPGFFKEILQRLIEARKKIKAEMKRYPKNSEQYRVLDVKQSTIKILTNSFYGYMGWSGARWYVKECAEATTAWGRYTLLTVVEMARKKGIEVLYGDTDSIFVLNSDKVQEFLEEVNRELPLELEVKGLYKTIFFTEKRKRYAGLLEDGSIDVKGFEVKRGDWSELAKEVQEEILRVILVERDPNKALEYVRKIIRELKDGKIPLEKLAIYKTITKELKEYKSIQAHVMAAMRAADLGRQIDPGTKIGFVVVKGSREKVRERAIPVEEAKKEEIDVQYYIEKQVLATAHRILKHFGYSKEDLLDRGQVSLMDFLGR